MAGTRCIDSRDVETQHPSSGWSPPVYLFRGYRQLLLTLTPSRFALRAHPSLTDRPVIVGHYRTSLEPRRRVHAHFIHKRAEVSSNLAESQTVHSRYNQCVIEVDQTPINNQTSTVQLHVYDSPSTRRIKHCVERDHPRAV